MLTLAPLYFEGDIAFGVITQGSSAFRTILAALSFVVSRFDSLGGLMAETARITALESQLTAEGTAAARHERDALRQDAEREKGQRCIRRTEVGRGAGGNPLYAATISLASGLHSSKSASNTVADRELGALTLWAPGQQPSPAQRGAGLGALCQGLSGVVAQGDALLIVVGRHDIAGIWVAFFSQLCGIVADRGRPAAASRRSCARSPGCGGRARGPCRLRRERRRPSSRSKPTSRWAILW